MREEKGEKKRKERGEGKRKRKKERDAGTEVVRRKRSRLCFAF